MHEKSTPRRAGDPTFCLSLRAMSVAIVLLAAVVAMPAAGDLLALHRHSEVPRQGPPGLDAVPIEQFGAVGDGQHFWGELDIAPLDNGTSRIRYTGEGPGFDDSFVGRQFVSGRIHLNGSEYPEASPNYFPGLLSCRYATVTEVQDRRHLIVDFAYNGGDRNHPRASEATDGLFFTCNREAFARAVVDAQGPQTLVLQDGAIYVLKGLPSVTPGRSVTLLRSGSGGQRPRLKLSLEDAFNADALGRGAGSASFRADFHDDTFFRMPSSDVSISFEGIDIVGPTYLVPVAQYGFPLGAFFRDDDYQSRRTGHARIIDSDMDAEKKDVMAALGELRAGMSWALPDFAVASSGGTDDGSDVTALAEYGLYNTSWRARTVHSLKGQTRAGVLFKAVSDGDRLELREDWHVKSTEVPDVLLSFHLDEQGYPVAHSHSDHFNWLMLANQDWSGGTSNNYHTFNVIDIDGFRLHLGNNADWWATVGQQAGNRTIREGGRVAGIFDRIPVAGDRIQVLAKVDDTTFDIHGWGLQVGDVLEHDGAVLTIVERTRVPDIGGRRYGVTYPTGAGDRPAQIKPWRVKLDQPVTQASPVFVVRESKTAYLLDGQPRPATALMTRGPVGHLFYTSANCNFYLDNVATWGYWRSTARGNAQSHIWAVAIAVFRNTIVDPYGYPWETHVRAIEWQPAFLRQREAAQGPQYRWIIDNSSVLLYQTPQSRATVETRNAPAFVSGARLHNPINGDDTGVRIRNEQEGGSLTIMLTDGHSFSARDLTNANLRVSGQGTLRVDGYTGWTPHHQGPFAGRTHGLALSGAGPLRIIGEGGRASVRNEAPEQLNRASQLEIRLTNWTAAGEYFGNRFLALGQAILNDPDFDRYIQITDPQGQPLER